jgi:pyridoxine 5-phosphate synthase
MVRLSVNVNKVATLRNARGGREPRVLDAVRVCLDAGVAGITVHPRADQRHIRPGDVRDIARMLKDTKGVEFNIEGDARPDLLDLVDEIRPDQCTLVPVTPGEVTSHAGWRAGRGVELLPDVVKAMKDAGTRVSLFVDADVESVQLASMCGADRVEIYTEPFARAFESSPAEGRRAFEVCADAARAAHALGMGVNAGHDLDLDNLVVFRDLPHLDEVSIGHAIISRAVFVGLETVLREYLAVLVPSPHQ